MNRKRYDLFGYRECPTNWKVTMNACCVWVETSWVEFGAEGIFWTGPFLEEISWVETALEEIFKVATVREISLLISWYRMEIRCSPNVGGIWSVTDWGSLLVCYGLGREIAGFGRLDVLAPDPSVGGFVP
jgi:hypothetical protein